MQRYTVELQNAAGERRSVTVALTAEQQKIVEGPRVVRSAAINGFLLHNAEKIAPKGFQWAGDLAAIKPVN
jgi:hypothetical protein